MSKVFFTRKEAGRTTNNRSWIFQCHSDRPFEPSFEKCIDDGHSHACMHTLHIVRKPVRCSWRGVYTRYVLTYSLLTPLNTPNLVMIDCQPNVLRNLWKSRPVKVPYAGNNRELLPSMLSNLFFHVSVHTFHFKAKKLRKFFNMTGSTVKTLLWSRWVGQAPFCEQETLWIPFS